MNQDVLDLEVSMSDALKVHVLEPIQDLCEHPLASSLGKTIYSLDLVI